MNRNLYELRPTNKPLVRVRGLRVADVVAPLPSHVHVRVYCTHEGTLVGEVLDRQNGRAVVLVKVEADARQLAAWLCERGGEAAQVACLMAGLVKEVDHG